MFGVPVTAKQDQQQREKKVLEENHRSTFEHVEFAASICRVQAFQRS